jgi:hypothetical protein
VQLLLVRHAYLPDATLGTLYTGDLALATLEEPWIVNPNGPGGQCREAGKPESCVPDGAYQLLPHNTPAHRFVWALENPWLGVWHGAVPPGLKYGRSAILIHKGNTVADTEGCLLVGVWHGRLNDKAAVLESARALKALQALLGRSATHSLTIRPTTGTTEIVRA